jgi:hypothetical protein
MIMHRVKTILQVSLELVMLGLLSLAEMDAWIRVLAGIAGLIVAVMTVISLSQKIRLWRTEYEFKKLELKEKQEKVRRYFEEKYTDNQQTMRVSKVNES